MQKQPLSYQQQNSSCWITSMFNGMIFLLGNAGKIPNIIARILYTMSSREGTNNDDAEYLINFISDHKRLPIKCEVYKDKNVNKMLIKKLLKQKKVIICDVLSGNHSILITELINKEIGIFDPDWDRVSITPQKKKGPFIRELQDNYNVKVSLDHFDRKKKPKKQAHFYIGNVKSRFIVAMFKEEK